MTNGKTEKTAVSFEYDLDFFEEFNKKLTYNKYQAEYYRTFAKEDPREEYAFLKKAEAVESCSNFWDLWIYNKNKLKQVVGVNRCHDSFCYCCQSVKARRRFELFSPVLKEYEKEYDVYHIVFTVPNVDGSRLKATLDKMTERFARIIRYFEGSKKIAGIDFERFGYVGAVRSLEITTGKRKLMEGNDFHPHFHCMFILRKGMNFVPKIYNSFSLTVKNGKKTVVLFTAFEVLLQRIWCLLMLDLKVTLENICNIAALTNGKYKDGFDVKADDAEGNYHEIFKYAIKGTYKKESIFSEEDFRWLYYALRNRRCYQTYGVLGKENFNDTDDVFSPKMKTDLLFDMFLAALQKCEKPFQTQTDLDYILSDLRGNEKRKRKVRYFGPSTLRKAFIGKTEEEMQEQVMKWIDELKV